MAITIPNSVSQSIFSRLAALGPDQMIALNARVLRRARRLISRGASVQAYALQRHYPGQRATPIVDAEVRFRLETSQPRNNAGVKRQLEWLELFASLPRQKRSNIQFQYRVTLPWGTKGVDSRESLRLIAESWIALAPLLDVLRSHDETRAGPRRSRTTRRRRTQ